MNKLSIITVTYNSGDAISTYLENIRRFSPPDSEIILLDNNSTDQTIEIIKKFPNVKLIEKKENLGFSKGNNLAAHQATGKYILFLNPDCKLLGDCIKEAIKFLDDHAEAGIVAPKLIEKNGQVQPSVRKLPTILGAIKEYYLNIKNSYEAYAPTTYSPIEVESVVGAAIIIKRELFLLIGGFNEQYFMYYEDLDLCRKVRKQGLKVYYFPECCIEHQVGGSISERKVKWLQDSARAYHGRFFYMVLSLILRLRPIKERT